MSEVFAFQKGFRSKRRKERKLEKGFTRRAKKNIITEERKIRMRKIGPINGF
jgi:hypothetical protein